MNTTKKRRVSSKRLVAAVDASTQRHTDGEWETKHPGKTPTILKARNKG